MTAPAKGAATPAPEAFAKRAEAKAPAPAEEAEAVNKAVSSEAPAPVVVLAVRSGDVGKQAALVNQLARASGWGGAVGKTADRALREDAARTRDVLRRSRTAGADSLRGGGAREATTLTYDLAPAEAARFLQLLAARSDVRVAVESRKDIDALPDPAARTNMLASLTRLEREADRKKMLALANGMQRKAQQEAPQPFAGAAKKAAAPGGAGAAAETKPAEADAKELQAAAPPAAAKPAAPEPAPPADAESARQAETRQVLKTAEGGGRVPTARRVRVVVRLLPE
jgi:hypothetical protein